VYVTFAYIVGWGYVGGLQVVDVTDPNTPIALGNVFEWLEDPLDVAIVGSTAFVAAGGGSFGDAGYVQMIDVANPAVPAVVGFVSTSGPAWGVAVGGGYACVISNLVGKIYDYPTSVQVINVTHPDPVPIFGDIYMPGPVYDVALSGRYACITVYGYGFYVIDVLDPFFPAIVGSVETPGNARGGLEVVGHFAYVMDGDDYGQPAGLRIIDFKNPSAPQIVGSVDIPSGANDVAVSGNYAYVISSGLRVIDISNPTAPAIVGGVEVPGVPNSVDVSGKYAYVGSVDFIGQQGGLQVIDVSNPAAPVVVASMDTPGSGCDVAVLGDYAYIADRSVFQVIDISTPESPAVVGSVEAPNLAGHVVISGQHAYVGHYSHGLRVIDISNPALPAIVGGVEVATGGQEIGMAVSGGHVYVGAHFFFQIVPAQCEEATAVHLGDFPAPGVQLALPAPNPAKDLVRIDCSLPGRSHVTLGIYDVQGRVVSEIADGLFEGGAYQWTWDGRASAPGIYFVRLQSDREVRVSRLALIH
jgi:hypothetical protein